MDGLSQEEIDALMNGTPTEASSEQSLSDAEKDAIGEIANINMGTAATTLSTLLNEKVTITTPRVSYVTIDDISKQYDRPCVFIHISYIEGLQGNNILILKDDDVKIITDLMMGGDGTNIVDELSELHLSAISEAMNQMMGSAATSLSSMLDRKVDISPPSASLVDLNDSIDDSEITSFLDKEVVQVSFEMKIGTLIDSEIMQLYPFEFARELYQKFSGEMGIDDSVMQESVSQPQPAAPAPDMSVPPVQQQPVMQQPMIQQPMMQQPVMQQPMMQPGQVMQQPAQVNVSQAQFQSFAPNLGGPLLQQENIDLIMDVPLEVTVELGRANKSIKEILDFKPGTIIELNRLAGEPVDVLVNGKFVAKGEVVVIEESFGIRIAEISK